jgi:hypothetical protein
MEMKRFSVHLGRNYHLSLIINKDLGLSQMAGVFVIFGVRVKKRQRIDAMVRSSSVGVDFLFFKLIITKFYERQE